MKHYPFLAYVLLSLVSNAQMQGTDHHKPVAAMRKSLTENNARNFFEAWQRLPAEEKKNLFAAIHRGIFGNLEDVDINSDLIEAVTQSIESIAAYPTLNSDVRYLQDSGSEAIKRTRESGAKLLEIDGIADATGHLVFSHAAFAGRQTLISQPWSNVNAQDLTQQERRMIVREFKNGDWTKRYIPLKGHVLIEREFVDLWLAGESDTTVLVDLKGEAAKYGFMFAKRYPQYEGRIIPMIYNTGFPGAAVQFMTEVTRLGGKVLGSDPLAITTNPNAFQEMSQLQPDEFNSFVVAKRQIEWVSNFIRELNIVTAVVVMGKDWKYYNPHKHTVEGHPKYGTIDKPEDVRRFEILWIGEQIRAHIAAHHPGVVIGAPSNRPVLIDGNVPYVDHFVTGKAVRIDPDTVNAYVFEEGGKSHNLKDAGAHYVITEDPKDVTGNEDRAYKVTDYTMRNYPGALAGIKESDWLEDPNYE